MAKVSKRGGFSDRNAIKPINMEVQLTEFDQRTRIQLLNMINGKRTISSTLTNICRSHG